jgi:hypothetical protein
MIRRLLAPQVPVIAPKAQTHHNDLPFRLRGKDCSNDLGPFLPTGKIHQGKTLFTQGKAFPRNILPGINIKGSELLSQKLKVRPATAAGGGKSWEMNLTCIIPVSFPHRPILPAVPMPRGRPPVRQPFWFFPSPGQLFRRQNEPQQNRYASGLGLP